MTFKTKFDFHARVFQNPGNPIKELYSPRYDDHGNLDLQVTGEEDLYAYIQSHKESCDIHLILERFASGEEDVLSRAQGFYADMSGMPKTYMEVLNSVIAGEHAFDSLPAEIKRKFDNSFAVWMSQMDQPDFADKMGFAKPEIAHSDLTSSQQQDFVRDSAPTSAPTSVEEPSS